MSDKPAPSSTPRFLSEDDVVARSPRFFGLRDVLAAISTTLRNDFAASAVIGHPGDVGDERERFLQSFLRSGHFPRKYEISKGHGKIISTDGRASLQTDIVMYDAYNCPVLRDGHNHQFFPIESVYAVIEVKSRLTKDKFVEAATNIASVKALAKDGPVELRHLGGMAVVRTRNPFPFGAIFAYSVGGNSLDSLAENVREWHQEQPPQLWPNLVCVLDEGIIYVDHVRGIVLDSRDIISVPRDELSVRAVHKGKDSLLYFYLNLIGALGRLELPPPPLDKYVDLPVHVGGLSYRFSGHVVAALSCPEHGLFEPRLAAEWIRRLKAFVETNPPLFLASEYMAWEMGQPSPMRMHGRDLDDFMPAAQIYVEGTEDLPALFRMRGQHPNLERGYIQVTVNDKELLVPRKYLGADNPFFEKCPSCPAGTPPLATGGY